MKPVFAWYIKDRVILHRAFGDQTLDMIKDTNDHLVKMLKKGKPPVHLIIDARHVGHVPTNLLKLNQTVTFLRQPTLGWFVAITDNKMISFISGILPQFSALERYRVMQEPTKALSFLKEQDATLDWSVARDNLFEVSGTT